MHVMDYNQNIYIKKCETKLSSDYMGEQIHMHFEHCSQSNLSMFMQIFQALKKIKNLKIPHLKYIVIEDLL